MASVGVWDLQYENTLASSVNRIVSSCKRSQLGCLFGSRSSSSTNDKEDRFIDSDGTSSGGGNATYSTATGGRMRLDSDASVLSSACASMDGNLSSPLFAAENRAEVL